MIFNLLLIDFNCIFSKYDFACELNRDDVSSNVYYFSV